MLVQLQAVQELLETLDRKRRNLRNILPAHRNCQRSRLQPLAAALMAGRDTHEFFVFCLGRHGRRLPVSALHITD